MGHDHHHAEPSAYYLEQLCTIGFCGALGVVQILLYEARVHAGNQEIPVLIFLDSKFHVPVLLSGITLTALAVLRAVSLWCTVGKSQVEHHRDGEHQHAHDHADCCHGHDHEHEPDHSHEHDHICDHDHEHGSGHSHDHEHTCDHDHEHQHEHAHADCGHDHGWAPWRYAVLLLPIVLFMLGMPSPPADASEEEIPPGVELAEFKGLQEAAFKPVNYKALWEKHLVRVRGQFAPGRSENEYRLFRLKMSCCAADAYPVYMEVLYKPKEGSTATVNADDLRGRWVNVTGEVHFGKVPGRSDPATVLWVTSASDILPTHPDPNLFLTN